MDTHPCSEEELGLVGDDRSKATFMPMNKNSENYVRTFRKKMLCLNKEDLSIYGSWDTKFTKMMDIQLRKCTNRPDCKSEQEILQFFRDKFVIVLHNQVLFDDAQL